MSCEIIQLSVAARLARPVSDKQAPWESPRLETAFLRQGSSGAKESQSSCRRRPKPAKFPNPDRAPQRLVACLPRDG